MKAEKSLISIFLLLSIFSLIFLFLFLNTIHVHATPDNTAPTVKIPPPIEGLIPPQDEYYRQILEKAEITILTAGSERHNFTVELARTAQEQAKGLMHRDKIEKNTGMLFLYTDKKERNFWMKNTLVPLDILFIRRDGVVHHIHPMATPKSLDIIKSNGEVFAALEIGGGEAEKLNINIGDRVLYDVFLNNNAQ